MSKQKPTKPRNQKEIARTASNLSSKEEGKKEAIIEKKDEVIITEKPKKIVEF